MFKKAGISRKAVMVVFAVVLCLASAVDALSQAQGRQYEPPYYVFSPDAPHDIVTHDLGAIGTQAFVNILAWDTFIAINWPVPNPIVEHGVPDRENVIGGMPGGGGEGGGGKSMPVGPVVWETFKDSGEIFLNPPVKPSAFDAPEILPAPCKPLLEANSGKIVRTLSHTSKVSETFSGTVLSSTEEAFVDAPLIDQNGKMVWYEIKDNRAYYDYVVDNKFYDQVNQASKTISFPSSSNTTDTPPVIKVKAAWKVLGATGSAQPDDPSKFYTTEAYIYDPDTGTCTKQQMGLVGLHVVMKTEQLPQWMWATFEHVDNAPSQEDIDNGTLKSQYNFYNPKCSDCPVNASPAAGDTTTPVQVVRVVPIDSGAASANETYQTALGTLRPDNVWQNYMLVNAQWALTREHIGVPVQPAYLANTTMETYLQTPVVDTNAPHGCINCHGAFASNNYNELTDLDFQVAGAYSSGN